MQGTGFFLGFRGFVGFRVSRFRGFLNHYKIRALNPQPSRVFRKAERAKSARESARARAGETTTS